MPTPEFIVKLRAKIGHDLLLVPAASAVVINAAGQILLQRRGDSGEWGLPGGFIEPGEEPAAAAVREVYEETGVRVRVERVSGVYGGADLFVDYPNGDRSAFIAICFVCLPIAGEPRPDGDETLEAAYFPPNALPELSAKYRERIEHALRDDPAAYFQDGA